MSATVQHLLLDEDGAELRVASFSYGVDWQPGETIIVRARFLAASR